MKKEVKIILYCLLGIIIILVCCLMIGGHKHSAGEPDVLPEDLYEESEVIETANSQPTQDSEQDILDDLESLFHGNEGYENVEGEYGFINAEA